MPAKNEDLRGLEEIRDKMDEGVATFFQKYSLTKKNLEDVAGRVRLSKEEVKAVNRHRTLFNTDTVRRALGYIRDGEVTTYRDLAFALGGETQYHSVSRILTKDRNIEALAAPVINSKGSNPNFFIDPSFETKNGKDESRVPYLEQRRIKFTIWKDGRIRIPGNQHVTGETLLERMSA